MTLSETLIAALSQGVLCTYDNDYFRKSTEVPLAEKIFFETEQGPYGLPAFSGYKKALRGHEVAIGLHTALAELLDRHDAEDSAEDSEEPGAVAVGSALSVQNRILVVYVASDGNKDLDLVEAHLRRIWTALQEISRVYLNPPTNDNNGAAGEPPESKRHKMEKEFRRFLYEYPWNRQIYRYEQYKDPDLLRFLEEVLDRPNPNPNQSSHSSSNADSESSNPEADRSVTRNLTPEEVQVLKHLRDACRFMERCTNENAKSLDKDGLEGFVLSMVGVYHLSKKLGKEAHARWNGIFRDITGRYPHHFIGTFIEKISFIERSAWELLRLSYSRHLSSFLLQNDIDVVLVPTQPVLLKFDMLDDPELRKIVQSFPVLLWEDMWKDAAAAASESSKPESNRNRKVTLKFERTVYPHCESALLAYLIANTNIVAPRVHVLQLPQPEKDTKDTKDTKDVNLKLYNFIGVSESSAGESCSCSCTACLLYFQAYNDIAEKEVGAPGGLPKFHLSESESGSHTYWEANSRHPWANPKIPFLSTPDSDSDSNSDSELGKEKEEPVRDLVRDLDLDSHLLSRVESKFHDALWRTKLSLDPIAYNCYVQASQESSSSDGRRAELVSIARSLRNERKSRIT